MIYLQSLNGEYKRLRAHSTLIHNACFTNSILFSVSTLTFGCQAKHTTCKILGTPRGCCSLDENQVHSRLTWKTTIKTRDEAVCGQ